MKAALLTFLLLQVAIAAATEHSWQDPTVMELGNRIGAMEAFSTELCKMLNPAWR
jgi:hypothetical protein